MPGQLDNKNQRAEDLYANLHDYVLEEYRIRKYYLQDRFKWFIRIIPLKTTAVNHKNHRKTHKTNKNTKIK